jgi:hypothetical protein
LAEAWVAIATAAAAQHAITDVLVSWIIRFSPLSSKHSFALRQTWPEIRSSFAGENWRLCVDRNSRFGNMAAMPSGLLID